MSRGRFHRSASRVSGGAPPPGGGAAREARLDAGLSLAEAARRARVSPAYLRRVEREGAPYVLARRLASLYTCRIDLFLPTTPTGGRTTAGKRGGGRRSPRPGRDQRLGESNTGGSSP